MKDNGKGQTGDDGQQCQPERFQTNDQVRNRPIDEAARRARHDTMREMFNVRNG